MGYEVLDTGSTQPGWQGPGAPLDATPVDVVAFDRLSPDDDAGLSSSSGDGSDGPRRRGRGPSALAGRRLLAAVVATLVVGVLAGSWWGSHHAADIQRSRQLAAVHAYAIATGVDTHRSNDGQVADFAFTVFNIGDAPLRIAVSPADARPSLAEPLMSVMTGDGTIAPGRSAAVSARVPLDCTSSAAVRVTVPVLSSDGHVHRVSPVGDQAALGQPAKDLCTSSVVDPLVLSFDGSVAKPLLVLKNATSNPLTVAIDPTTPMSQASGTLHVSTTPAMPVVVPANGSARLLLQVDVSGCPKTLSDAVDPGGTYLQLQIEAGAAASSQSGIDIGPIAGAALQRACFR